MKICDLPFRERIPVVTIIFPEQISPFKGPKRNYFSKKGTKKRTQTETQEARGSHTGYFDFKKVVSRVTSLEIEKIENASTKYTDNTNFFVKFFKSPFKGPIHHHWPPTTNQTTHLINTSFFLLRRVNCEEHDVPASPGVLLLLLLSLLLLREDECDEGSFRVLPRCQPVVDD